MDAAPPPGYLDAVGGQPLLPAALSAWQSAAAAAWADPAAVHHPGRQARQLLEAARSSIATSLTGFGPTPIRPQDVHFAATIDLARAAALAGLPTPVTLSDVEALALHAAVGAAGRRVAVDALGRLELPAFLAALADGGSAAVQAANPEVGTTQPVSVIAATGVPLLVDAGQTVARRSLPERWSALTVAGTDVAGPAGVALLVTQAGSTWVPPQTRGTGWLAGTPDIPGAVALAMALETLRSSWSAEADRAHRAIDAIRAAASAIDDVEVLGDPVDRLPHVATFSALFVSGEALVSEFARQGFAVASGSACLQFDRPSHVLAAMGAYTGGNVRISLPFGFADETVDRFIDTLPAVVADTRKAVPGA